MLLLPNTVSNIPINKPANVIIVLKLYFFFIYYALNASTIEATLSNGSIESLEVKYKDVNYGEFKKSVAEVVVNKIGEIQSRYNEIINSNRVEEVLAAGAEKARYYASRKLSKVYRKLGLKSK